MEELTPFSPCFPIHQDRAVLRVRAPKTKPSLSCRRKREFISEEKKDACYWEKRRKNNEAAKRSREKRRLNDLVLEGRVMALNEENVRLKTELLQLKLRFGLISASCFMEESQQLGSGNRTGHFYGGYSNGSPATLNSDCSETEQSSRDTASLSLTKYSPRGSLSDMSDGSSRDSPVPSMFSEGQRLDQELHSAYSIDTDHCRINSERLKAPTTPQSEESHKQVTPVLSPRGAVILFHANGYTLDPQQSQEMWGRNPLHGQVDKDSPMDISTGKLNLYSSESTVAPAENLHKIFSADKTSESSVCQQSGTETMTLPDAYGNSTATGPHESTLAGNLKPHQEDLHQPAVPPDSLCKGAGATPRSGSPYDVYQSKDSDCEQEGALASPVRTLPMPSDSQQDVRVSALPHKLRLKCREHSSGCQEHGAFGVSQPSVVIVDQVHHSMQQARDSSDEESQLLQRRLLVSEQLCRGREQLYQASITSGWSEATGLGCPAPSEAAAQLRLVYGFREQDCAGLGRAVGERC
ncbi:nuclear factor interleukin-3-regulated protein [Microcaecilia unicolor]|uniref:Nuclear factor interleukin-3-regulated protein n=1 Tax=Microcaecilia unicolor TaxID=1415580 RepID=A0A6P7XLD1_9AMPH|nr:nuclear factor interleukin-3-regulated protein-like [Microcaecilia unicolor]XP_030051134.1 nuclear factor interleukin-3-regulated protein-like [Microcaecilia unicolor]